MIQLHILSGKKAGSLAVAGHFPFRIGRAPENDLSLEDAGIWEQHVTLEFKKGRFPPGDGFKRAGSGQRQASGEYFAPERGHYHSWLG